MEKDQQPKPLINKDILQKGISDKNKAIDNKEIIRK